MLEKSCGTVPYTLKGGVIYYLLISSKDNKNRGFPKGHVEVGESEIETALRETLEETSLEVEILDGFRHEVTYTLYNGNIKTVVYFLADFDGKEPRRNSDFEDFKYLILPYEEAYSALTFDNAKELLEKANEYLKKVLQP
jgi:8-oxo-dGTP pyrophosphatase MutT (NUDIX family)